MMSKYDASVPRRRYWSTEIESSHLCPECRSPLEQDYQTYLIFVKQGRKADPYLTADEGGWFCPNCPVVVLDHDEFVNTALIASGTKTEEFAVVGVVNWEAIPEEKKHLPLGDDDNPIPLVEFLDIKEHRQESRKRHAITRKKRRRSKRHSRRKKKKKRK